MSTSSKLQTIIAITGDDRCGKSTVAEAFIRQYSPKCSLLLIDADPAAKLCEQFSSDNKPEKLTEQVQQWLVDATISQEGLDWYFGDLVHQIIVEDQTIDSIAIGKLPFPIPKVVEGLISYGLNRICKQYDWVIVDNANKQLLDYLEAQNLIQIITVASPTTSVDVFNTMASLPSTKTKALLINRLASNGLLPTILQQRINEALDTQEFKLVGRLNEQPEGLLFNNDFLLQLQDCFYRVDLPQQ